MKSLTVFLLFFATCATFAQTNDAEAPSRITIQRFLGFEQQNSDSRPTGWFGGPAGTVFADSHEVHSGRWSARLERGPESPEKFSALTRILPIDFTGQEIELVGYLRLKDVSEFAGLWMREDGEENTVAFENMEKDRVNGTRDWAEYRIKLPLQPAARRLVFGVLTAGTGTLWADDLQLLVDSGPVADAAVEVPSAPTVLDTDHEFDSGSRIQISSFSAVQADNLATLGRVWGFLKYHHRAVAGGKRHWDYDLFRILPAILAAPDQSSANAALVKWIDTLDPIGQCSPCASAPSGELNEKPDLGWIRDTQTLGTELSRRLQSVYINRTPASQFYVGWNPGAHNPAFRYEPGYGNIHLPDAGYQLLALFRWWNIMQYWAPYRDVAAQNWPSVLRDFIPRIALAGDKEAYQLALFQLIAKANDTHANLWSSLNLRPPTGECDLPVTVRFIENKPVVVALDASGSSPIKVGDAVATLDGVPVASLFGSWAPYYADSNAAARQRDMAAAFTRGSCGPASLDVVRDRAKVHLSAERVHRNTAVPHWHDLPGDTFRTLSNDVAYLKLSSVKAVDVPGYMDRAASAKGLIVDIRSYPSEFMPFVLGAYVVKAPTAFAAFTIAQDANPGAFAFQSGDVIQPGPKHFAGKVVILLDEVSQSQAEYTAMALRAGSNAVIVGSTTAGADGNVSAIPLPGGFNTMISGIGIFYPDHRPTQRIGIVPDLEVEPTLTGIKAGRDEVLETAIRQILGPAASQAEIEAIVRPSAEPRPNPAPVSKDAR
jgi:C-terminal processing protease CtpA/Prc